MPTQITAELFADIAEASDVTHRIDQGIQRMTMCGTHRDLGPWTAIQDGDHFWIASEAGSVDVARFLLDEADFLDDDVDNRNEPDFITEEEDKNPPGADGFVRP
ncbi:hypothetical protein [Methylobacterium sp. J-068]|uniref:hypothetical protein n=1 Tax=Methylobacterium sp. J-068 TaxID=2836649 RepID=UPI001FBACB31|nr:hypothetical protein [Methylobacterium sp. J-068]MCJ2035209.1 hypothetical protein [Methylobacterium sp. J-068]